LLACLLAISLISKVDVMKALTLLHKTNVVGTLNMLGLAKRIGARFLLTSTSEVYGDPLEHPQKEEYWGNVNPIGLHTTHYPLKPSCSSTAVYALVLTNGPLLKHYKQNCPLQLGWFCKVSVLGFVSLPIGMCSKCILLLFCLVKI
jgi:hypothetical protein